MAVPGATWAQAIHKALETSEKCWLSPTEIYEEIKQQNLRDVRVSTPIHSIKRILYHSCKNSGPIIWDREKHCFALKTRLDGKEKKETDSATATTAEEESNSEDEKEPENEKGYYDDELCNFVVTVTPTPPSPPSKKKKRRSFDGNKSLATSFLPSPIQRALNTLHLLRCEPHKPHRLKNASGTTTLGDNFEIVATVEYERVFDTTGACVAILSGHCDQRNGGVYEVDPSQPEKVEEDGTDGSSMKEVEAKPVGNKEAKKMTHLPSSKPAPQRRPPVEKKKSAVATDDGSLSTINLKSVFTVENFTKLPYDSRVNLIKLLPVVDRLDKSTPTPGAFSHTYFTSACRQWQQLLQSGQLAVSQRARQKQEESNKKMVDEWKKRHYEEELSEDAPPQPPSQKMFYPVPLSDEHQKLLDCIKRTSRQSLSRNNELASSSSGAVSSKVNNVTSEQEVKSPKQSSEQATRSPEQAASLAVKSPVIRSPERVAEVGLPELSRSPELPKQVIRSPDQVMTSTHEIKSLGRPLKLGIPSTEPLKSPTQVISPEQSKQGLKSSELCKQGTRSPELSKQGLRLSEPSKSLKQGIRSPELAKQGLELPELSKSLIRLPELAKQGQKLPELEMRPPQKTLPNHGIRLPTSSKEVRSHDQVRRSHDQVRRSPDLKTSGRIGSRSLGLVKRSSGPANSSSLSKLPDQTQPTTTKTVPNESPADRLLADNRVCRLAVTPLKRPSPGQQQSNGPSNQQQLTNRPARQRTARRRQPIPPSVPTRILKLPKKHFPNWHGHQSPVKNCKVSVDHSRCDGPKSDSNCANSTAQVMDCNDNTCVTSTKHCNIKCARSAEHDGKCASSTAQCESKCSTSTDHCGSKCANSAEHDGKCTAKCDSPGSCSNDAINRTQNTIYGNSAGCSSHRGSDVGRDHCSNDKLSNPRLLSACSNAECSSPMNLTSQDKDPRLNGKGVKRPCVSDSDCSKKKCCGDGDCGSRSDLLSDLPKRFSYATLYQSLKKCSSINSNCSPVLPGPSMKEASRQVHPVLQEHSYPVYYDTEMPLLLEQQREGPPCSVCSNEKMWVCMMCEKVTHSWCLARPHTYCWDCLRTAGNILTDVK